jgi:hypothetical protein
VGAEAQERVTWERSAKITKQSPILDSDAILANALTLLVLLNGSGILPGEKIDQAVEMLRQGLGTK